MSGQFIDEPVTTGRGGHFIDDQPVTGGSFIDGEAGEPAEPDFVLQRLRDPRYVPSKAEFEVFQKHEKDKPLIRPMEWVETTLDAGQGIYNMVKKGAVQYAPIDMIVKPGESAQTVIEATARGTMRDLGMLKKVAEAPGKWIGDGGLNEDQYLAARLARMNQEAFPEGMTPVTTFLKLHDIPAKTMEQWKSEFKNQYKPDEQYQIFLDKRAEQASALDTSEGRADLVPHILGKPNNDLAEGLSLVTAPSSLVGFGGGAAAKTGATLLERGAAATAKGVGRVISGAGRAGEAVAGLPGRIAGRVTEALSESAEAGAKAGEMVDGQLVASAVRPSPSLGGQVTSALGALRAAAKPVTMTGDALQAAGRAIETGPSRTGLLGMIASDGQAPKWLRISAGAGRRLDPLIEATGAAAQSAVHGAAVGGVLGGLTDGEEGVFGGIGSGAALGAAFSTLGRLTSGKERLAAKQQGDLNRWFNSKSMEEQANIAFLRLPRESALKVATIEQMAKGMRGASGEGDMGFVYLRDADFQRMFNGSAKGAEMIQGEQPRIFINVDRADVGTIPHEFGHGLLDLALTPEAKADLRNKLFTQVAPDGSVLTRGIFTPDDIAKMEDQYVSRLHQKGKIDWANLTPEQRQTRIMGEITADAFANLIKGTKPDALLKRVPSIRQRIADKLIQGQQGSMLAQMRRGLEAVGVKFKSNGEPSELFARNGQPITNSPQVDAALRDFLRAKLRARSRLVADDETPAAVVVRLQDLNGRDAGTIAQVFKDNDTFAKDAAGQVQFQGGQPVLLTEKQIKKLQTDRAQAMMDVLEQVPDLGDVGTPNNGRVLQPMRKKESGAWEGNYFSDAQIAALEKLPDSTLSPSMKTKIRQMNDFHKSGDGNRLVLDYNAATSAAKKGGRVYSSAISSSLRDVVPLTMHISKAGNFYMTSLDTTVLYSKLNRWFAEKPKAFEAWGRDRDAFTRDMFKYLDNHANGRSGSIGLDPDPLLAVEKKHVLNDLFGISRGTGNNPIELSTKTGKDQLIRSFRFDRTNRITESGADPMPINYYLQKSNFLPAAPERK